MLGNNSSFYGDTRVLYLKLKGLKKDQSPYFEISEKNKDTGKVEPTGATETVVSGNLIDIGEMKSELYPDKFHGYMILQDMSASKNGESYRLNFSMSNVMRNIINNLAGADQPLQDVKISVYTDKQGYAKGFVTVNGAKVDWKYSWEEISGLIVKNKVKKAGKTVEESDYYEVDKKLMEEGLPLIKANCMPNLATTGQVNQELPETEAVEAGVDEDDLPF